MPFGAPSHLTLEQLENYALGRAKGCTVDHLEEHLLLCDACREALDQVEQELRILRIVLGGCDFRMAIQ